MVRAVAAASSAAILACGGGGQVDNSGPDYGQPSYRQAAPAPRYVQPSGAAGYASTRAADTTPLAPVRTTDPKAVADLVFQAQAAPAAVLAPSGQGDPIELGLRRVAAAAAPGIRPEGLVARGTLSEGGHLSFDVLLAPGKCYTIVGFALPGTVRDLDLSLFFPPLYDTLAGQDSTEDSTPVIGGATPICPSTPLPLHYKVDIRARTGAGNVGVQVYSKAK